MLSIIIGISSIFSILRAYLYMVAGERIVAKLRKDLYSSLIVQEIGFFDETKTGELLNRLSSDCVILFKLY